MKEIWKDIEGYSGDYQISNYGRVKSFKHKDVKILTNVLGGPKNKQYYKVTLSGKQGKKQIRLHILVWEAFGDKLRNGHKLQVDHIDNNKLNNRIDNLQLLTNRENSKKDLDKSKTSSKYIGTFYHKLRNKWCSAIRINGKQKWLGSFNNEIDAANAYKKALENLENN